MSVQARGMRGSAEMWDGIRLLLATALLLLPSDCELSSSAVAKKQRRRAAMLCIHGNAAR